MFGRSSSQTPNDQWPREIHPQSAAHSGRVRIPFLTWGWMAGLGCLAWSLVSLSNGITPTAGKTDHTLLGKRAELVESVAFHPGGRWLASAGGGRLVSVWDMSRRELAMTLNLPPELDVGCTNCLVFTPDGSNLAVAQYDGSVTLWDVASGNHRHSLRVSPLSVRCLAFSPDGRLLATGSNDHKIALWDVATLRRQALLLGCRRQINSLAFSPDGRTLASASADGPIRVWDVSSGEIIRTVDSTPINSRSLVGVAYSPDGRILATVCPESGVALWDASTGRRLKTAGGGEPGAMTLAFSPVGAKLAWGTVDGRIELWEAGANRRYSTLRGHSGAVKSLAFSPDGKTLVSGGNDGTVRVWEVAIPDA
jgi:WD40 repeat protein